MATYPDLAGKVAIVTGAALNTGYDIADAFAEQRARVLLVDILQEAGELATQEIAARGGDVAFQHADVGSADDIAAMVQRAVDLFGRVDVVINNARDKSIPNVPVADLDPADWDRTYAILIRSHFLAAKYAIPAMIANSGGTIIGISSVQGRGVSPSFPAYCSAKAAVDHLMRQIAYEYGPHGIRANAIAPGGIWSTSTLEEMQRHPDQAAKWRALHPVGRVVTGRDIANVALFLASEVSATITGQSIVVDGGYTLPLPDQAMDRVLRSTR
ncbi:MAG: SDR family oxidoreductase [Gemmatimonadetes bacterium]|nr:SDR family oxidoreductase [Gemmatimonadota bacterium]